MPKRTDSNQTQVVKELRHMGYSVEPTHELGNGCPDIMVGKYGFNFWVEIKDPSKPPSKCKLTPDEEKWHEKWQGNVLIGYSSEQIDDYVQDFMESID